MTAGGARPRLLRSESLPPQVKILALFGFVVAVVCTPREAILAFGLLGGIVLAVGIVAGVRLGHVGRRLLIEAPFVVFALALPIIGTGPRVEVWGLSLSEAGLWAGWSIIAKGTLGVAASLVLAATTPAADLIVGLERLRIPRTITAIAGFMVRYAEVVEGELHRLQVARISRGDDPRWIWQIRATATTVGVMFVRSYERGERVHTSMLSRGFDGRFPSASNGSEPRAPRAGSTAVLSAAVGAAWIVAGIALVVTTT